MSALRKQNHLEELFMKILKQVRASGDHVRGGTLGVPPQSQVAWVLGLPWRPGGKRVRVLP